MQDRNSGSLWRRSLTLDQERSPRFSSHRDNRSINGCWNMIDLRSVQNPEPMTADKVDRTLVPSLNITFGWPTAALKHFRGNDSKVWWVSEPHIHTHVRPHNTNSRRKVHDLAAHGRHRRHRLRLYRTFECKTPCYHFRNTNYIFLRFIFCIIWIIHLHGDLLQYFRSLHPQPRARFHISVLKIVILVMTIICYARLLADSRIFQPNDYIF